MSRIALYARYSSDNQRDASIDDQLRLCRLHAERQGWTIVDSYCDRAVSGASLIRPGIQELIADAQRRRFDIILTESIDRLSRDQEDIAGLYKRMRFAGVKIVTLSEGDVSELHIGLKGTMGALYLKDLADKTRRGLRGRIELGKAGGGNSYGYDVIKRLDENGEPQHGDRSVNEGEAATVRRIFREYAAGKSSRAIAWQLNKEKVPGPFGREWGPSTIHGNPQRGNGILNNELYVGKLVWNRQRFLKDPDTGKRVARPNPKSEWVNRDVPELRIIDQDLWEQVKARQAEMAIGPIKRDMAQLSSRRRPRYLLAGLLKCDCCGSAFTLISKDLLGCAKARNKGTCQNRLHIRVDTLEASVVRGLRKHMMDPVLIEGFCREFTQEVNRARISRSADLESWRTELKRIDRDLGKLLTALKAGGPMETIVSDMQRLEARKAEVSRLLAAAEEPPPLLHPNMSDIYRQRVSILEEDLRNPEARQKAMEGLRQLIDHVRLVPEDGELGIVLRGDLAAILAFVEDKKKPGADAAGGLFGSQLSLVAGIGFEPMTFRL